MFNRVLWIESGMEAIIAWGSSKTQKTSALMPTHNLRQNGSIHNIWTISGYFPERRREKLSSVYERGVYGKRHSKIYSYIWIGSKPASIHIHNSFTVAPLPFIDPSSHHSHRSFYYLPSSLSILCMLCLPSTHPHTHTHTHTHTNPISTWPHFYPQISQTPQPPTGIVPCFTFFQLTIW